MVSMPNVPKKVVGIVCAVGAVGVLALVQYANRTDLKEVVTSTALDSKLVKVEINKNASDVWMEIITPLTAYEPSFVSGLIGTREVYHLKGPGVRTFENFDPDVLKLEDYANDHGVFGSEKIIRRTGDVKDELKLDTEESNARGILSGRLDAMKAYMRR